MMKPLTLIETVPDIATDTIQRITEIDSAIDKIDAALPGVRGFRIKR
jgi:hypothetical protein